MAKINRSVTLETSDVPRTHEGGIAKRITPELELRRSVMSCLLWENEFYESGVEISKRIASLIPSVKPQIVAGIAIEARSQMKLRHVPLLIVREMARGIYKSYVRSTLFQVIQRADELAEFLAIYWKDGKCPLSSQVKKGLADAFLKFDAYQLAKYNRDAQVKLRDVMFLCHPKPVDKAKAKLYKKLANKTLEPPDTWEVALSAGDDKKKTWERLIKEDNLGPMALLRNLRNMKSVGVDEKIILNALKAMKVDRVLPFRFITAARHAPQWEPQLEEAMFKSLEGMPKLPGKTILLVDVSGSMDVPISDRTEVNRIDAACGIAILAREMCKSVSIYTFSNDLIHVPARRGFALRDAIQNSQEHGGTYLGGAIDQVREKADRIIVFTDEQAHDTVGTPRKIAPTGYIVNVASNKNGVGYGTWHHIDGFSEAILSYIVEYEKLLQEEVEYEENENG